jgi:cell division transport system ATP-binding protein
MNVVELVGASIYQGNALVLRDVNLRIQKGEFVYLIGKTGSGKSSLLKVIYGDLPLGDGSGTVVGLDLRKLTWKKIPDLRRKLGVVFQDFNLLTDRNVDDNLLFVLRATGWDDTHKMKMRVNEVLDLVGLKTKGFKKPFELSGGEQQRVVVARALLNHPELILADEPTGNLDPETSDEIIRLLFNINRDTGTPVLMATHDYMIIEKFPSRILRCQDGQVAESESILAS